MVHVPGARPVLLGGAPALAAALLLTSSPSASANHGTTTLRYTSTNPQNTDLDLGTPGPGPGDTQVFVDELIRRGRTIGHSTGACQIALLTDTRLVTTCTSTATFTDGSTITMQGVFGENPQSGPEGFRWAVTGGTGRYRGASGQAVGTFVPNSDTVNVVVSLAH